MTTLLSAPPVSDPPSESTGSFWQRLVHGVRRTWHRSDWAEAAGEDWADRILEVNVTDRFHAKQGRSTGRWIVADNGRRLAVYLKRHYRLSWWRRLAALVLPARGWSPAWQEWQHLCWAQAQGFPVPAPVAVAEFLGPWGKLQSVLAIEELADMLPLNEAIPLAADRLDPHLFHQWKRGLVSEVAHLVQRLHRQHYFHKDLYLCHFYITRAHTGELPNWSDQVHLIDLHRLGRHSLTRLVWQVKDLAQLLYSSDVPGVTPRDRLSFWRLYLGKRPGILDRLIGWITQLKWLRYRDHNTKRKRRVGRAS